MLLWAACSLSSWGSDRVAWSGADETCEHETFLEGGGVVPAQSSSLCLDGFPRSHRLSKSQRMYRCGIGVHARDYMLMSEADFGR